MAIPAAGGSVLVPAANVAQIGSFALQAVSMVTSQRGLSYNELAFSVPAATVNPNVRRTSQGPYFSKVDGKPAGFQFLTLKTSDTSLAMFDLLLWYDGLNILAGATRLISARGYEKAAERHLQDEATVQFGGTRFESMVRDEPARFLLTFCGHQDPVSDKYGYAEFSGAVIVDGGGKVTPHHCVLTMDDGKGHCRESANGYFLTWKAAP